MTTFTLSYDTAHRNANLLVQYVSATKTYNTKMTEVAMQH